MTFLFGFLCCWVALALFAWLAIAFNWADHEWVWWVFLGPIAPLTLLYYRIRERLEIVKED